MLYDFITLKKQLQRMESQLRSVKNNMKKPFMPQSMDSENTLPITLNEQSTSRSIEEAMMAPLGYQKGRFEPMLDFKQLMPNSRNTAHVISSER